MSLDIAFRAEIRAALEPLLTEIRQQRDALARLEAAQPPSLRRLDQLHAEYGIPPSTARMKIRQGVLKATKLGRVLLVDVSQLRPLDPQEIATRAAEACR